MNAEFILALNQIEKEKGISKDILIEAIENSLITACKNNYGTSQNIKVIIDRDKGDVTVYAEKEVVETVEDPHLTISLEKAKEIDKAYELGDIVNIEVTPKNFGRIAAGKAKQVVVQKIREAERDVLFSQYITKEKEIVTGIIQREVKGSVVVNLGKIDAMLVDKEQVPGEVYPPNERLKVYVIEVKESTKGPKIYVSRTHPELIKRLFEQEVPEVHDGVVEIKSISREAGSRTKIAVYSNNPNVDPVGSCVGHNGSRVGIIVHELKGEKIDIVPWSEDPSKFISAALSPSKVVKVAVDIKMKSAKVVVPDYQLSLAIGKEGQNARLAAKLTGYKIDIKSETQAKDTNFILETDHVIIPTENKFVLEHRLEEDMDIFAKPAVSKEMKDLFEE
ncbi:MAG: transcription termination/antitermination protein NusA [Firmicutes bacterium HGW-Firmicutes-7]|nr:MAG: transcription termination/antitermination protein NusA [Firmicutes bacterium HGW-Firmicutes-7]